MAKVYLILTDPLAMILASHPDVGKFEANELDGPVEIHDEDVHEFLAAETLYNDSVDRYLSQERQMMAAEDRFLTTFNNAKESLSG